MVQLHVAIAEHKAPGNADFACLTRQCDDDFWRLGKQRRATLLTLVERAVLLVLLALGLLLSVTCVLLLLRLFGLRG